MSASNCFLAPPNLSAAQALPPCRFIYISAENTADLTPAGYSSIGVTQEFTQNVPNDGDFATATAAAATGKPVPYHPIGTVCDLELGGTVVAGGKVMADGTTTGAGKGLAHATTGKLANAIALRGGDSGEKIPVYLIAALPYNATYI